jgi:hypothetical protein
MTDVGRHGNRQGATTHEPAGRRAQKKSMAGGRGSRCSVAMQRKSDLRGRSGIPRTFGILRSPSANGLRQMLGVPNGWANGTPEAVSSQRRPFAVDPFALDALDLIFTDAEAARHNSTGLGHVCVLVLDLHDDREDLLATFFRYRLTLLHDNLPQKIGKATSGRRKSCPPTSLGQQVHEHLEVVVWAGPFSVLFRQNHARSVRVGPRHGPAVLADVDGPVLDQRHTEAVVQAPDLGVRGTG